MRRAVAAMLCGLVLVTACSDGPGKEPEKNSTDAVRKFGYGPTDDPNVSYQPDVIRIGGGPEAIKRASNDGLQFTIDGDAPGAKDLAPGKVMFASALAVGRVVAVKQNGDDRDVLLGPVTLTDVIRDGKLSIDQPLDLKQANFQSVPDQPGAVRDLETPASAPPAGAPPERMVVPALQFAAPVAGELPNPEPAQQVSKTVGEWTFTWNRGSKPMNMVVKYDGKSGLKFTLNLGLDIDNLRIKSDMEIRAGATKALNAAVGGIKGLKMSFQAGSANGLPDNKKMLIELPVEISKITLPIYGVPTVVKLGFKVSLTTGFSAKDSVLSADAVMKINGDLGINGGQVSTPTLDLERDPLESVKGVSMGASGVVAAIQYTITWGLGIPAATAGITGKLTGSFGVANGSGLGFVKCRSITLKVDAGIDSGFTVSTDKAAKIAEKLGKLLNSPEWADAVKEATEKLDKKLPKEELVNGEMMNVTRWYPDAKICKVVDNPAK